MENLPKLTLCTEGLRVDGFAPRTELHQKGCVWRHPTALVLLLNADGQAVLVDKYRKDYYKALWAGRALPQPGRKWDAFGGHIKKEGCAENDFPFLTYETYLRAAVQELQEECRLGDAKRSELPVDESRLQFLGFSVWEESVNRECSAFFIYRLTEDLPLQGCDDGYDSKGVLQTIELDTVAFDFDAFVKDYLRAAPDISMDPAPFCADGLARLIRLYIARKAVPAQSEEAKNRYRDDIRACAAEVEKQE